MHSNKIDHADIWKIYDSISFEGQWVYLNAGNKQLAEYSNTNDEAWFDSAPEPSSIA